MVMETLSIVIKLVHFLVQLKIILMPSDPKQFLKIDIDEVKLFEISLTLTIWKN